MGRDVPFYTDSICDICGESAAYDFMGDNVCQACAEKVFKDQEEQDQLELDLDIICGSAT